MVLVWLAACIASSDAQLKPVSMPDREDIDTSIAARCIGLHNTLIGNPADCQK